MKKTVISSLMSIAIMLVMISPAKAEVVGIDVSRWQGVIDWESARTTAGFAIIKAGGSDEGMYTDSQFERNRDEARRLDIPRGYYYYTGGGDPILEAEHFASIVGELQPGESVALDYEIDVGDPVAYAWMFLVRTEQLLGVKPLFYTNMNRAWGHDWKPVVDNGNPLWGAIYDKNPAAMPNPGSWTDLSIKQFTSEGTVPGIGTGAVDLNVLNYSIGDFRDLGMPEPVPAASQNQAGIETVPVDKPAVESKPDNEERGEAAITVQATSDNGDTRIETYVDLDSIEVESSDTETAESTATTDADWSTNRYFSLIFHTHCGDL